MSTQDIGAGLMLSGTLLAFTALIVAFVASGSRRRGNGAMVAWVTFTAAVVCGLAGTWFLASAGALR